MADRKVGDDRTARQVSAGCDSVVAPLRLRLDEQEGWLVLGIDPGERGAAALVRAWPDRYRPELEGLTDASELEEVQELATQADLVVVEGQQASPQMGVVSAFRLGQAYGRLQEAVEAVAWDRVVVVPPTAWKGAYGLVGGKEGKVAGVRLANRLLDGRGELLRRHDQADAVLLGWWGWRHRLLARVMQELQASPGG